MQTEHLGLTHIGISNVVQNLKCISHMLNNFKIEIVATASIKPSIDVAKNLLHSIMVLFIKVRAFSYGKDVII